MIELSVDILLFLFGLSVVAGFIDSIAGGGGLITVPGLLAVGISPIDALGTNKLQSTGGSGSATLYFTRKKLINWKLMFPSLIIAFGFSCLGTLFVQSLELNFLNIFIPFLLLVVCIFFIMLPNINKKKSPAILGESVYACTVVPILAFYDGTLGPGTGTFMVASIVFFLGNELTLATAKTKVMNFFTNLASLLFFALNGHVIWKIGFIMLLGQFIGAQIGSKFVYLKGTTIIRPMVIIISIFLTFKLLYDNFF